MVNNVDFFLNLNTTEAQRLLSSLHQRGNSLFSQKGYSLNLNTSGFERSLQNAGNRILSFTSTLTIFQTAGQAMKRLATDALQVETAMSQIQSILGLTEGKLASFTSAIFDMANKTGLSFSEASKAAEEFSRQGLTMAQTLKATESAMALVRVSGGDMGKAVQDLNALMSAFAEQPITFEKIADVLANLDASFSTTTTGLAEGLSRVSAVAAGAGIEFEKMASLIASVKQVSGRTEAVIGNAFKSIIINLGTANVQSELEKIDVATKNADGTFRQADAVLSSLAKKWYSLSDAQKSNLGLKVAGKYHKNILEAALLAEKLGVTDKAVRASEDAQGSIAKRLEVLNSTLDTSIVRLQNNVTKLATTNLGGMFQGFIEELIKYGNVGVDAMSSLFSKGNPIGEAISGGLLSVVKGPVFLLIGASIIKLFGRIVGQTVAAGRALISNDNITKKIGTSIKANILLEERMVQLLAEQVMLREKLARSAMAVKKAATTAAAGTTAGAAAQKGAAPTKRAVGALTAREERKAKRRLDYNQKQSAFLASSSKQSSSWRQSGAWFNIGKKQREIAKMSGLNAKDPLIAKRASELRQQRSTRLKEGGFGASFIIPMVTGAIASGMEEGKSKRLTESIGMGASTAAMGLAFGGLLGPIGILVGGFQILSTVTEDLYGNLGDVNRKVSENNNKLKEEADAGDAYVQAQLNFSQALKDGNLNAVKEARKALGMAAQNLPLGRKRLSGITDPEKLIEENNKANEEVLRKQSSNVSESVATAIIDKAYSSTFQKGMLSLTGSKKSLSEESGKDFALTFSKAINTEGLGPKIEEVLSQFRKTGDQEAVNTFVSSLMKGDENLSKSFKNLSDKFYNGSSALSNFIINILKSSSSIDETVKAQTDLQESTSNINDYFKKVISQRFSEKATKDENVISRIMTRIGVLDILGAGGTQTPDSKKQDFSNQLKITEIQTKGLEKSFGLQTAFRENVAKEFENITDVADKLKASKFTERMVAPDFDFSKFEEEFKNIFGDDTSNIFKSLKDSLNNFRIASKESSDATKVSIENENLLGEARKKVIEMNERASRFGALGEDQSEAIKAVSEGTSIAFKYLNMVKSLEAKKAAPVEIEKKKKAFFTPEVAAKVAAMDEANKTLGRITSIDFDPVIEEAKKSQASFLAINQMLASLKVVLDTAQVDPGNAPISEAQKKAVLTPASLLGSSIKENEEKNKKAIFESIKSLGISGENYKKLFEILNDELSRFYKVADTAAAQMEQRKGITAIPNENPTSPNVTPPIVIVPNEDQPKEPKPQPQVVSPLDKTRIILKQGKDASSDYLEMVKYLESKLDSKDNLEKKKRNLFSPESAEKVIAMDKANKQLDISASPDFTKVIEEAKKFQASFRASKNVVDFMTEALQEAQIVPEKATPENIKIDQEKKSKIIEIIPLIDAFGKEEDSTKLKESIKTAIDSLQVSEEKKVELFKTFTTQVEKLIKTSQDNLEQIIRSNNQPEIKKVDTKPKESNVKLKEKNKEDALKIPKWVLKSDMKADFDAKGLLKTFDIINESYEKIFNSLDSLSPFESEEDNNKIIEEFKNLINSLATTPEVKGDLIKKFASSIDKFTKDSYAAYDALSGIGPNAKLKPKDEEKRNFAIDKPKAFFQKTIQNNLDLSIIPEEKGVKDAIFEKVSSLNPLGNKEANNKLTEEIKNLINSLTTTPEVKGDLIKKFASSIDKFTKDSYAAYDALSGIGPDAKPKNKEKRETALAQTKPVFEKALKANLDLSAIPEEKVIKDAIFEKASSLNPLGNEEANNKLTEEIKNLINSLTTTPEVKGDLIKKFASSVDKFTKDSYDAYDALSGIGPNAKKQTITSPVKTPLPQPLLPEPVITPIATEPLPQTLIKPVGEPRPMEDDTRAQTLVEIQKNAAEVRDTQVKINALSEKVTASTEFSQRLEENVSKLAPLKEARGFSQIQMEEWDQKGFFAKFGQNLKSFAMGGETDLGLQPSFISPKEAISVKEIFNNSTTQKALDDSLMNLFGQDRFAALAPTFKTIKKDFSTGDVKANEQALKVEEDRLKNLTKKQEVLNKKSKEAEQKTNGESSSKVAEVNKTTADLNNQTAKLLGDAVKFAADVKLKIEAPTFSSDVVSQMTAIAKTQFSVLFKEATGKEPVLAPSTPSTAQPTTTSVA